MSRPSEPQPIERDGRKGHLLPDGAILWDDGEKEVPTSGKSDEQKRREARAEAEGFAVQLKEPGTSLAEIEKAEVLARAIADPDKRIAERKAAARATAMARPGDSKPVMPQSQGEIEHQARRESRRLLDREILRLEELKQLAIDGHLELELDGIRLTRGNPALQLHEIILRALRMLEDPSPVLQLRMLKDLRGWKGVAPGAEETLPQPPPDGIPDGPIGPPDPPLDDRPRQATDARQRGGQPVAEPVEEPAADDETALVDDEGQPLAVRKTTAKKRAARKPTA